MSPMTRSRASSSSITPSRILWERGNEGEREGEGEGKGKGEGKGRGGRRGRGRGRGKEEVCKLHANFLLGV